MATEPPDTGGGGHSAASRDDEARRLMDLAGRLPEEYREPLMLRAVHGMRGRYIAGILGISEATVETRIARARRMLRDLAGSAGIKGGGRPKPVAANSENEP